MVVYAATDGAAKNNNKYSGRWAGIGGIILLDGEAYKVSGTIKHLNVNSIDHKEIIYGQESVNVSNNRAELIGFYYTYLNIKELLKKSSNPDQEIVIYLDSKYVIGQYNGNNSRANRDITKFVKGILDDKLSLGHVNGHINKDTQDLGTNLNHYADFFSNLDEEIQCTKLTQDVEIEKKYLESGSGLYSKLKISLRKSLKQITQNGFNLKKLISI